MPKTVRWGVLGSGGIARRRTIPEGIIPADNADLTAVYDINRTVNYEVAGAFGTKPVDSIDDLLKAGIDAVYIATPANMHYEQVLACAKAGKHVLCEKPLGMTVDEARAMIAACEKAGVQLGTAFMMRYQTQHQAALKLIQDGRLGKPAYARAQLSCWYPPIEGAWRQDPATGGGGSLMDMGGHCIDLLEMFFGPVREVSCFINSSVHAYKSEDSAVAMLRFENGALGSVDTFFCIPDNSSKNVLELYGSKGSVIASGTIGQGPAGQMTAYLEADAAGYDATQSRPTGEGVPIAPTPVNTYQAEIEDFSRALLEGRSLAPCAQAGLRSQQILAACYESARTGRTVTIA
ncbi:MAG TPA: Gfo/Idh/MocA family oxidoreductase [Phycisphaerae bacterium]|jgi:predicted dehydrogenase|nr:Gfo/Idh/MocA family oxidoreductase [Phycisphaerae bacterium]HOB76661.1 Gfo/Idh/MocA family oxidoreductase [Phycisphaerae bacterium]HOJ54245.1 Gfo/Idh/MocA family oxidoreductase [Phycisphaerae bacterium]HOL28571.1 Gfo/Idh/MocA family oxidoreductase [Phycisphaerae bacterium]HPP20298.1 Gfo/Idh/MocA family oxidoreductase [Phycisphaerae bacterium]